MRLGRSGEWAAEEYRDPSKEGLGLMPSPPRWGVLGNWGKTGGAGASGN